MALQKGQNSLLESPTGSGKSLALLCAALAWQRREITLARDYNMAVEQVRDVADTPRKLSLNWPILKVQSHFTGVDCSGRSTTRR